MASQKFAMKFFLSMVIFDEKMTFVAKAALVLGFIKFINLSLMETLELGMQFQTNLGFKDLNYRCKCFKSTWKKLGQICSKSFSPERQILGG